MTEYPAPVADIMDAESVRTEGEEVYEVEASSEEEAESIALERFDNEAHCDAEVEDVEAEVVDD